MTTSQRMVVATGDNDRGDELPSHSVREVSERDEGEEEYSAESITSRSRYYIHMEWIQPAHPTKSKDKMQCNNMT